MLSLYRTLSLRYHRRRFGRAALVIVSIALGVGTLVSTRALNRSMEAAARSAVAPVGGAADLSVANGETGVRRELAAELRGVPGLRAVVPLLAERVPLTDFDNRLALLLGVERPDAADSSTNDFGITITVNRPLALLSQYPVLVGEALAAELPAGPVRIRAAGHDAELAPLGTVRVSGPAAELGGSLLILDLDRAAKLLRRPNTVSRIDLFLQPGADPAAVRRAVETVLAGRALMQTMEGQGQAVGDVISGVQAGFALSGVLALMVGLFLVYNALAVSVAERRHEIGILRSLGATRGQIAALFAGEAVGLGFIGSLLGLPLGVGLAWLALAPMRQVLSEVFLAVEAQAVQWPPALLFAALAAGVFTALVASLVPAVQAAADEPADAVRRAPSGSIRLVRVIQGLTCLGLVTVGMGLAYFRESLPPRVGSFGGIILTLLGALLAAPLVAALGAGLIRPLTRLLPGVGLRLAADNLLRAPSRTGVVVGALTAGVALSVQVSGVLESNERPIIEWVDRAITTDLIVTGGENTAAATSSHLPLDTALGDELRRLPGVRQAVSGRYRRPTYRDTIIFLLAFDAAAFHDANLIHPDYPGLDLFRRLAEPGTVIISDNFAVMHGVDPGDVLTLQGTRGPVDLRILGAIPDYSWTRGTVFIDRSTLWQVFEDDRVDIYEVYLDASKPGAQATAEAAVRAVAARRALTVVTRDDLRNYISGALHRLFGLVQVQQFIVGAVASLGVVTALLISVLQRRRELGLLRSVGATRAQVLRSVLAEAALLGLFGTVFGLGVGLVFEWYVIRVLIWEEGGFVLPILIPWAAAATVAGVSLGLAVLAGLGPALHAARLQIAEVVAYE